jgi:hypothetical protein
MKHTNYERPNVETLPASQILELLGPVSCGSGGNHDQMIPSESSLLSTGNQRLGRN